MNSINELNALLTDFNKKKDMLDNHTDSIVREIKRWCLEENNRLEDEYNKINHFIHANKSVIYTALYREAYCDYIRYKGHGLDVREFIKDNRYSVGIDIDYEYSRHLGTIWSKLPKPRASVFIRDYDGKYILNENETSLDYWNDVKRYLAIRNEYLTNLVQFAKDAIGTLILEQERRCNEFVKNCKDITNDDTIEVKISVRRTHNDD